MLVKIFIFLNAHNYFSKVLSLLQKECLLREVIENPFKVVGALLFCMRNVSTYFTFIHFLTDAKFGEKLVKSRFLR